MYYPNPIPSNFKYLSDDWHSNLFLDMDLPDGTSLVLESTGFTMCEREFPYEPWRYMDDLLVTTPQPEYWIKLGSCRITKHDKPKRALTDRFGHVMIVP